LVENIRSTNETLKLSTNGGDILTNKRATVPGYGEVWYDPNAIANIFSLAEMEKKYCITYNSLKEKAFVVHLPNKKLRFMQSDNGIYIYKPNYTTNNTSLGNGSIAGVDYNNGKIAGVNCNNNKIAGVDCNNGKIAGVGNNKNVSIGINYNDKNHNHKENKEKFKVIKYCPTNIKMIADYMTKPLTGSSHYHKYRQIIMNSG
jgi:hypothetical protein